MEELAYIRIVQSWWESNTKKNSLHGGKIHARVRSIHLGVGHTQDSATLSLTTTSGAVSHAISLLGLGLVVAWPILGCDRLLGEYF